MPPGIWLLILLLTLFLLKKRELLQKALIVCSVLMIWLTSTNYFAVQLTHLFGSITASSEPLNNKTLEAKRYSEQHSEQAIVILGSGRRGGAIEYPEYQNQDIGVRAMERVRYGVTLAKATHLPILLAGGAPDASATHELAESDLTQRILKNEFQSRVF